MRYCVCEIFKRNVLVAPIWIPSPGKHGYFYKQTGRHTIQQPRVLSIHVSSPHTLFGPSGHQHDHELYRHEVYMGDSNQPQVIQMRRMHQVVPLLPLYTEHHPLAQAHTQLISGCILI